MLARFWSENLKERDHTEDGVDGKIILECILGKQCGNVVWAGCIWLRKGTSEHGNESLGSIKGGEFLD